MSAAARSVVETLERRTLMAAAPVITEFVASNANGNIAPVTINVSGVTPTAAGGSAITFTFTQTGKAGPSLTDGRYRLVIDGSKIKDTAGATLDAAGTAVRGSSRTEAFFRLAGDTDGNAQINFGDFLALQTAFGTQTGQPGYQPGADLNGDGRVDLADFLDFQTRYGMTV